MSGFLLDTSVLLPILNRTTAVLPKRMRKLIGQPGLAYAASVASLWEIAIKVRIGKLSLSFELNENSRSHRRVSDASDGG